MRKLWKMLFLATLLLVSAAAGSGTAFAQDGETPGFKLSMSRDWGYGGLNGRIQGLFSLKVKDAEGLTQVTFYMDDTVLFVDNEPPFKFQYRTDDYPPGAHTLWAQALTADGQTLESNRIEVFYLTKAEAGAETRRLLIPILGVTLVAVLASVLLPALLGRKKTAGAQNYQGLYGGTICPHCGRPYAMHFYGLNLLTHRFDRCPHCGRWALVRRQPLDVLLAAEEAQQAAKSSNAETPEDEAARLKKMLDDSRYDE